MSPCLEVALLPSALIVVSVALGQGASQVAAINGANLQRPSWSADGAKLSFEANFHEDKRIELYVGPPMPGHFDEVHVGRRSASNLTAGFQRSGGGRVVHELSWGPSGAGDAQFVFSASNDVFDYDLYTPGGTALAPFPGADGGAVWSPDGSSIVFTSARTGEGDLYLIRTDATEQPPQRLTSMVDSSELYVTWSPDGNALVFVAHSEAGDNLWVLPAVGAEPARLTQWPGNQIRPQYAPDDGRVAFYANHEDPERFDLYVVELGTNPRLIVRGVYPDAQGPAWTPDGRHIIFVADDDDALDPVRAVHIGRGTVATLGLDTVGNGDLDVVERGGRLRVAVVAQGRQGDSIRDFKRLFVADLAPLP